MDKSCINAIVLAAGLSTRMGEFKQLMPYRGKKVIVCIVEELLRSNIKSVYVVAGHNKDLIVKELSEYDVNIIFNPDYKEGMHTSIMCGVSSLPEDTKSFMLVLGDQPELDHKLVNDLIHCRENSDKGIVIPSFSNRRGHPVIFDKKYIEIAANLNPDTGLKQVINDNKDDIEYMIVKDDRALFDIDTPSDYKKLLNRNVD